MIEYSNAFSFLAPSECNQYKILNDSDRHSDFGRGNQKCDLIPCFNLEYAQIFC